MAAPNEQALLQAVAPIATHSTLSAPPASQPVLIPLQPPTTNNPFGSAVGPHHQTYQVERNGDSVIRVESDGSITDTSLLLQTTPTTTSSTARQASTIFYLDSYLLPGSVHQGRQASNSSGGALGNGVTLQSSPTPAVVPMGTTAATTTTANGTAGASEPVRDRAIKIMIASLLTTIATGAVISVASGLIGNEKAVLTHEILFKAFTALCYVSLVSAIGLLLLVSMLPKIPALATIVRLTTWVALTSFVYAIDCLICIQIRVKTGVIIALVVPFVLCSIVIILHFSHNTHP